jgi:hypothetical protein
VTSLKNARERVPVESPPNAAKPALTVSSTFPHDLIQLTAYSAANNFWAKLDVYGQRPDLIGKKEFSDKAP